MTSSQTFHTVWNHLWKDAAMVWFACGLGIGSVLGFLGYCAFDNWLSAWPE